MELTSTQNPRIKSLLLLTEKAAERQLSGLFVVEGPRELERALKHGFVADQLFHCEDIFPLQEWEARGFSAISGALYYRVNRHVFSRIAYRDGTGGVVAVMRQKGHSLDTLKLSGNPLLLVLESVEKPGNLGALLRTADAAGLDGIIVCDPRTDIYNPNVVRSSTGALFSVPLAIATTGEVIAWLDQRGVKNYCTSLAASVPYHEADMKGPLAIVMGAEAEGLSETWIRAADENILIPMRGTADSLNVSVSAAIVVFEALRQREGV
ncbi:MAG TPA: RNA methyltransferase [Bacteroidales bacterium]|nr:RNA methyltransferase [Bacteroidales bacterium]